MMDFDVLEVKDLPKEIGQHFMTDKVMVMESDEFDGVRIIPYADKNEQKEAIDRLCGMFKGKLSVEEFMAEKQFEKELEERRWNTP
ncbi:MAG: hypothetical protein FWC67_03015 [Defluviitaleaceae bacterium]|nr:hypothetical protein [Defluviitaleaceae bacterium]